MKIGAIVQSEVNTNRFINLWKERGHNSENTKRRKAEKLGNKIVDEDTYIKMIS